LFLCWDDEANATIAQADRGLTAGAGKHGPAPPSAVLSFAIETSLPAALTRRTCAIEMPTTPASRIPMHSALDDAVLVGARGKFAFGRALPTELPFLQLIFVLQRERIHASRSI
jgi:hypothetical protein